MRGRSNPYNDTTWDENGVLGNAYVDDYGDGTSHADDDGVTEDVLFIGDDVYGDNIVDSSGYAAAKSNSKFSWIKFPWRRRANSEEEDDDSTDSSDTNNNYEGMEGLQQSNRLVYFNKFLILLIFIASAITLFKNLPQTFESSSRDDRPAFVYEHPYISSSYYTSTKSISTLKKVDKFQVKPKKEQLAGKKAVGEKDFTRETKTRLAILRPFCAFDAGPLPTTFDCWQNFPPCRASAFQLGEELDPSWYDQERYFDDVGSHMQRDAKAGKFTFSP